MAGVGTYGGYSPGVIIGGGGGSAGTTAGPASWTPTAGGGIPYPPGPSVWPAGQSWPLNETGQVNGQDLNQQLSLPVSFLAAKPFFQGAQWTPQSIPNTPSPGQPVTLDTEMADAWNMHANYSDSSQVVIPDGCDGIWLFQGNIPFSATANHRFRAMGLYNGTEYSGGEQFGWAQNPVSVDYADLIPCNAGDILQLAAWQDSGAAVNTFASSNSTGATPFFNGDFPAFRLRWVAGGSGTSGLSAPNITAFFQNPVTSADFNNYITNSVNFLSYVPYCRAIQTTPQAAISSGASTQMTGMTSMLDNYGQWNAATSTWTCQVPGIYLLFCQAGFPNQGTAYAASSFLRITSGGNTASFNGSKGWSFNPVASVMRRFRLNAGDTVQVFGFQTSGSGQVPQSADVRFFSLWQSS
jgi:hypothetical protein